MAADRAMMAILAGLALVMASRSTLFTQPPAGSLHAERSQHAVGQVESGFMATESLDQRNADRGNFSGLLCGLVMGLSLAFAGAAQAEEAVAPADYDIRKGQSAAERKLWNAEKFKKWGTF
eukprot:CAMPEP_0171089374 /NCGR_PEP_ID=MMETSP0766_2-20121228/24536_1 /TAXON_ID=439317 /ORGANISM="Gambierdiscus australes, Strain CAWD 149" /LENGTH=120 /DNA_ID=CAMNT_0011547231 /DNA_START=35 /DNA_END=394 /DNA_ORIENTATION=+